MMVLETELCCNFSHIPVVNAEASFGKLLKLNLLLRVLREVFQQYFPFFFWFYMLLCFLLKGEKAHLLF